MTRRRAIAREDLPSWRTHDWCFDCAAPIERGQEHQPSHVIRAAPLGARWSAPKSYSPAQRLAFSAWAGR